MKHLSFEQKVRAAAITVSKGSDRAVLATVVHDGPFLVATDTHRLTVISAGSETEGQVKLDPETGQPWRGVPIIEKKRGYEIEGGNPNDVSWHKVATGYDASFLSSAYPQWRRVVPEVDDSLLVTLSCSEIIRAFTQLKSICKESANCVRLSVFEDGAISFSARATFPAVDPETQRAIDREVKDGCTVSGSSRGAFEVAFNYKYMLDVCKLAKIHGDQVITIRLQGNLGENCPPGNRAFTVTSAEWLDGEPTWKVVMMPMALP